MQLDGSTLPGMEARDTKELSRCSVKCCSTQVAADRTPTCAEPRLALEMHEEVEIYGLKKSAEELTSQAHAQAIRIQLLQRMLRGMETQSEGIANAR